MNVEHGAFSTDFARKKRWKLNTGLCRALLAVLPECCSVNDLGAGVGKYVAWLREHGREAYGYDGIDDIYELSGGLVQHCDLAMSGNLAFGHLRVMDWTICIETGEHIPPHLTRNFVSGVSYSARDGLVISWGTIGQRGRDHVACHMPEYVAALFSEFNWRLDEEQTLKARKLAGKGWSHKLLVFGRE